MKIPTKISALEDIMAANECYLEDLEPEAKEFPFFEKRKQGVPFPSSVYGRSVAEKYLTSDRNRTPDRDSTDAFASRVERTKGLLRASPAATHLAIPGLHEGGAARVWRQSDTLFDVAEADRVGGDVDLDLELFTSVSAQGKADLPENVASGEPQVSSTFRALSKRFNIKKNSWQKVKRKQDNTRPTPVKPVEARRTSSDPGFDLESSPVVVEDSRTLGISSFEEDLQGIRLGIEDLSKYLIVPGQKIPLHVVPIEEVHPFAVPENSPLKFNTIFHNTILNDELDRKYDRIQALRRKQAMRATTPKPRQEPTGPPRRKACWGARDVVDKMADRRNSTSKKDAHKADNAWVQDLTANNFNEERSFMDLARSRSRNKRANLWENLF